MDCFCYEGRWIANTTLEFREYWLHSKWEEDGPRVINEGHGVASHLPPSLPLSLPLQTASSSSPPSLGPVHLFALALLPVVECTYETLLALYSEMEAQLEVQLLYAQTHYVNYDGLHFCHKQSHCEAGSTPLVLHFRDEVTAPAVTEAQRITALTFADVLLSLDKEDCF